MEVNAGERGDAVADREGGTRGGLAISIWRFTAPAGQLALAGRRKQTDYGEMSRL